MNPTTITIESERRYYHHETAAERTMTVRQLINYLEQFDDDSPVVISNDYGYTFSKISWDSFGELNNENN